MTSRKSYLRHIQTILIGNHRSLVYNSLSSCRKVVEAVREVAEKYENILMTENSRLEQQHQSDVKSMETKFEAIINEKENEINEWYITNSIRFT
jgi:hypothetical protein